MLSSIPIKVYRQCAAVARYQFLSGLVIFLVPGTELLSAAQPKVVSVFPADGSEGVPAETELKIQFDQPMHPGGISVKWEGYAKDSGFRLRGPVAYDPETFEFSLPVCLRIGCAHEVTLNPEERGRDRHFRSANGSKAETFSWQFNTARTVVSDNPAKIVSISPPPDTEIALVSLIRVKFDRPMKADWYDVSIEAGRLSRLKIAGEVTLDETGHEFTIPISFPPNWFGAFRLTGFVDKDGHPAESKEVLYRTRRTLLSTETERRLEGAQESQALIQLLKRVRKSYAALKSARVTTASTLTLAKGAWSYQLNRTTARFARDAGRYVGDVSEVMNCAVFKVGCDGKQCWHQYNNTVMVAPMNEIAEQNVSIAKGLSGLTTGDMQKTIKDQMLEYGGVSTVNGRRCHVLRGWKQLVTWWERTKMSSTFHEWLIDDETGLVVLVSSGKTHQTEYVYDSVNESIPQAVFDIPDGRDVEQKQADELGEGYNRRFLNVIDGSEGRMSVRWGKRGTRGTASSGLN